MSITRAPRGMAKQLLLVVILGGFLALPSHSQERVAASWFETGSMAQIRDWHTMTPLPNGKILAVGGLDHPYLTLRSCELYDPGTGAWSATGSMANGRVWHATTLLLDGKVLAAGGLTGDGGYYYLAACELYDPETGAWSPTGSLSHQREHLTATLLSNGSVLATGGYDPNTGTYTDSELYDPVTGVWRMTELMKLQRGGHTANLLSNGKVLVAGGRNRFSSPSYLKDCELYDLTTNSWSSTASMTYGREYHAAVTLPNGKVLVTGGRGSSGSVAECELYDPATGEWSMTGMMSQVRLYHSTTLLEGKVLAIGGYGSSSFVAGCELYDPETGVWSPASPMLSVRGCHAAVLLSSGSVLAAGGTDGSSRLASCELYLQAPKWQSITFDVLSAKTPNDVPFELTATATSGLSVRFESSNPQVATVSDSTVTIVGLGETVITALQDGNDDYAAAAPVQQTLYVAATVRTVSFTAGAHGKVTGRLSQIVPDGGDCTAVVAVADSGYIFSGWSGDVTSSDNPLIVKKVREDMALKAVFKTLAFDCEAIFTASHKENAKGSRDSYRIWIKMTFPADSGIPPPLVLDSTTLIQLQLGEWSFYGTLGDDPKSRFGKRSGKAALSADNGDTVRLTWDAGKLGILVQSAGSLNAGENIIYLYGGGPVEGTESCSIKIENMSWTGSISWSGTSWIDKKGWQFWTVKGASQ